MRDAYLQAHWHWFEIGVAVNSHTENAQLFGVLKCKCGLQFMQPRTAMRSSQQKVKRVGYQLLYRFCRRKRKEGKKKLIGIRLN